MRGNNPDLPTEIALDLLLTLFDGPRSAGDLADGVDELAGREVPMATFFRQVQKAIDRGWIEVEEPDGGGRRSRRGRPGRLYRITAAGERDLRSGAELQRRRWARAEALGLLPGGR
ncbi:MAG: hypothetical protein AAFY88_05430 [Acidobacteriota bacterium]